MLFPFQERQAMLLSKKMLVTDKPLFYCLGLVPCFVSQGFFIGT